MLAVSATDLSQAALEKIIADRCSNFGSGAVLRVLPPEGGNQYGVALVEMSSEQEAANLARTIGDSQYGRGLVAIKLYCDENSRPNAARLGAAASMGDRLSGLV